VSFLTFLLQNLTPLTFGQQPTFSPADFHILVLERDLEDAMGNNGSEEEAS
jgi:hypothetical protein